MDAIVSFEDLFERKINRIQVKGEGIVTTILNDDLVGRKHQRFILELALHKTLLVVNNIDIFPRLDPLNVGDCVEFFGEYVWNRHGGIIHWTHYDPRGQRDNGYVKVVADDEPIAAVIADAPLSDAPPLGLYRHYKGNLYDLIGFALHSETLEEMVIYKALYGERRTWVRPLSMWSELVYIDGKPVKRFEHIQN